jgi:colanic acid biosynthesis glycosyl transferase WcaI
MKILVYGINFPPELVGIGKYTGEMTEWLSRDNDIAVITAPQYYPEWKIGAGFRRWLYSTELMNGIKIHRCPIWVPAKPTGIKRILHLLSFTLTSIPKLIQIMFWKPDIIIAIAPPISSTPVILLTAWLSRCKKMLHVQDFEIDAAFNLGILKLTWLKKWLELAEGFVLKRFHLVSTISPMMHKRLLEKNVPKDQTYLFPNWVDINAVKPQQKNLTSIDTLDLPSYDYLILYAGNIGKKQGLHVLLDVAEMMTGTENDKSLFLIVGEGAAKSELETIKRKKKLSNVLFKPLLPLDTFNQLLTLTDIHLVIQNESIADFVMPSKLTGILSVGGCTIITASPDTQLGHLVEEYDIGLLIEPESVKQLYNGIVELLQNQELRQHLGANARQYAIENLSKDEILSAFKHRIIDLVKNN